MPTIVSICVVTFLLHVIRVQKTASLFFCVKAVSSENYAPHNFQVQDEWLPPFPISSHSHWRPHLVPYKPLQIEYVINSLQLVPEQLPWEMTV